MIFLKKNLALSCIVLFNTTFLQCFSHSSLLDKEGEEQRADMSKSTVKFKGPCAVYIKQFSWDFSGFVRHRHSFTTSSWQGLSYGQEADSPGQSSGVLYREVRRLFTRPGSPS